MLTPRERAERYVELCGTPVRLTRYLGEGTDGVVVETSRATAVKALKHLRVYYNERDTYLRLMEFQDTERIGEFRVPRLRGYDDELWVVEMDIMHAPPYVIDFGKVRLNFPPDFSDEVLADLAEQGRELFGANWPRVVRLLRDLESYQIYYLDPKPGNIVCD